MGKIIVIESGTDGAGKQTQTKLILKKLQDKGEKVISFSFPNYGNKSSYFVKEYLNGNLNCEKDPYIVSTLFALDRYLSYKDEIEKYYNEGYTIIFDRYVTSNMVYQASMLNSKEEIDKFVNWEKEYEYGIYKLPKPDKVIYLHMTVEKSQELIKERNNKITGSGKKDIYESNLEFLKKAYETSLYIAKKENWIKIECIKNGKLRDAEEISEEIFKKI